MRTTTAERARSAPLKPLVSPDIIGRASEIASLVEAATGAPSLIVIEGEAGVGKTRLVDELLRRPELEARHRLVGRSQALHEQFRFGPVVQAIRQAASIAAGRRLPPTTGALRVLIPELDVLPPLMRDRSGSHVIERHLLFRAIVDLLDALGPAVLVLEDTHWADRETVDLICFLAGQLPSKLALVVTYRREQLPSGSPLISLAARLPAGVRGGKLALQPLSAAEVGAMIGAILGAGAVSHDFGAFVHQRTNGLPFAVEEVLRLMLDLGAVVLRDGRWLRRRIRELGIPPAITDAVVQRFGDLREDARTLVEAAAVLDTPSAPSFIAAVAGIPVDQLIAALREARASGLLVEEESGSIRFRHVLARDAVYASIPMVARSVLHQRAAAAYERTSPVPLGTVAQHCMNAGDPRWLALAEAAADEASSERDEERAVGLLVSLLSSGEMVDPADRRRIAMKLGWAAYRGVVHDVRVNELLTTVIDSAELSPPERGELRFIAGFLSRLTGDASAAHREWEQAVPELGSHPLAAQAMMHLADPWVFEGSLDDHMMWLRRASEAAARAPDEIRDAVDVCRATILMYVGDAECDTAARRVQVDDASGERRRLRLWAHVDFSAAAFNRGRYADAAAHVATVRDQANAEEAESLRDALQTTDLMLEWGTGRWDGLEERASLHAEHTQDVPRWAVAGINIAASLALARGNLSAVERLARRCLPEAVAGGVVPAYSFACSLLARARLDQGRDGEACEHAMQGVQPLMAKGIWVWSLPILPTAIEALSLCGRIEEADDMVQRATAGLVGRDAPAALAAVSMCRGELEESKGHLDEAATAFADAERRFQEMPHPWFAAQARARLAGALLRAGTPNGREVLSDALAALTALGATADVHRIRRALKRHSITVIPAWRGGKSGYGKTLSPREMEVAHLMAEGLTNSAIGEKLFLSGRTIEHHLSSVMRKLGVKSRMELANRLRETGGEPP